jgi:hypothetical protein
MLTNTRFSKFFTVSPKGNHIGIFDCSLNACNEKKVDVFGFEINDTNENQINKVNNNAGCNGCC